MTWALALLVSTAALLTPKVVRAADAEQQPHVALDLSACETSFGAEVRRIASIELHADVLDSATARGAITMGAATCHDSQADLWISDGATGKVLTRTVLLSDTAPKARARLIALAIAELIAASWEELQSNPEPKAPPAAPAPPETRAAVRRLVERWPRIAADALADGRVLLSGGQWLAGGGARATIRLKKGPTLRFLVDAHVGSARRPLGEVAIETLGGSVAAGWQMGGDPMQALLWMGVDAGYARLAGTPVVGAQGYIQSGPILGPEAGIDVVLFPRKVAHVLLALAGGAVLFGVRGEVTGSANVQVLGPWAALTLGAGVGVP